MSTLASPPVYVERAPSGDGKRFGEFRGRQVQRAVVRVRVASGSGGFTFRWSSLRPSAPVVETVGICPRDVEYERVRSARRAGAALRERIITGGLRRMITFTHRENVTELEVSRACVRRFLRLARGKWEHFKWAGAAERQRRGAWHWHLAVNAYYDINVVRDLWRRAAGPLFGNVNVKAFDSASRGAFYLSKYLTKTFVEEDERPRYGHHYVVARGLRVDVRQYLLLGTTQDDLLAFVEEEARALGFATRAWCGHDRWKTSGTGWGDG